MDWQSLIDRFKPISVNEKHSFAPPNEITQIVGQYNRAIFNLHNENGDVALITLRKLAATYPDFTQATLLTGICQAARDNLPEARVQIKQAILNGLDDPWLDMAEAAIEEINNQIALQNQAQPSGTVIRPFIIHPKKTPETETAARVLEKTKRRDKVRMAGDKERQDIIRRGDFPEEQETNVKTSRDPVEYLRIAIPAVAVLLVVGLLIFLGIQLIVNISETNRKQQEAENRLDWLVSRLENLAGQDPAVSSLLDEYDTAFTTSVTTSATTAAGQTGQTTASSAQTNATTTAAPTTAAATTLSAAAQKLQQANDLYQQAFGNQTSDLLAAGDALLAARVLLAEIPETTTTAGVTGDAAALGASVEGLIATIGHDAAEANRVLGMELFNTVKYAEALPYFETGYQLYPASYGGGTAFYCGRCQQLLGNKEAARPYFEYVIANFPTKAIATYAQTQLTAMGY